MKPTQDEKLREQISCGVIGAGDTNMTQDEAVITERDFSTQIEHLFRMFGWSFSHTYEQAHYARRSTKGFPDYCVVRDTRLLFVELKSETGKVTSEQQEWWDLLMATRKAEVYLWRPRQFLGIVEILR